MKKWLPNEKGIALVVILAVVVLMSLVGTTILFSSNMGRKISTSYRGSAEALQNAEAGIAEAGRKLFNGEIVGGKLSGEPDPEWNYPGPGQLAFTPNIANEYAVSYVLRKDNAGGKSVALDEAGKPLYQIISTGKLNGNFVPTSSGAAGVEKKLLAMVQVLYINPAFKVGILSDGNLTINGTSNIIGGAHTNGDARFNGGGTVTGTVSAHGSINAGSWNTGAEVPNAATLEVPSVAESWLTQLRATAQASGIYNPNANNGEFTFTGSGDLGNQVIFADGNLTIEGSFTNGTIVATGNIIYTKGSSQINVNGGIGTAIVAQGNITMKAGENTSFGTFWSNGIFLNNGTARIIGSIVSRGAFTTDGGFNFTANDNIQNDNLPKGTTPVINKYKVLSRKEV